MPPLDRRIRFVGALPPYRGGISHFTQRTALGMRERGHEVEGITFSRQYPSFLFPGKSQVAPVEGDELRASRWIDTLNPWSWWQCARRLREDAPDAVVFNYWMPFFAPAYGSIARGIASRVPARLCIAHNAIPHESRPGDRALTRWFLRSCDAFLALSREVEADLRELGAPGPVVYSPHPIYDVFGEGVDRSVARQELGIDPQAPVVLFFGYVRPYKGLDVLLDAFHLARQTRPDLKLMVVGEFYAGETETRAKLRELGLEDGVRLVADYVPNEQVPLWFSACDVVAQPYLSATQSGVAQVAYQFERPVILTDVGGLAEIVPHERAGFVVPPRDPEALAAALVRFFEEDWAERLTAGVREERRRFAWEPFFERVEELVEACLTEPGKGRR